ncbi:hypothetical protein ACFE04_028057 [Oxalis oulophora]
MSSKLIIKLNSFQADNQFDLSLSQAFDFLQPTLIPPFPLTIPNPHDYAQLNMAILYGILTQPHLAITHIKHLHAKVTDGYALFVSLLLKVGSELYLNLVDSAKMQMLWVTKQMVDVFAVGFDGLLVCLLRQVVGGEFSHGNLWLCSELVNVFLSRWDLLLEEEPMVLTYALYVFLRLLADHWRVSGIGNLDALKKLEICFCVKMLKDRFDLCLAIGRDLIRLLQDLVSVPEFESIWKDIVLNPKELNTPGFSNISQIYSSRTSSRYFLLRITPEMETQLRFLLTHVKFGSQKRYQVWFANKFLSCPERETLIIDIVRFICCGHHPTNEILQSEIIPRWAVIGWLLSCCQNNNIQGNVRLSLFYDWLFFDERVDNIMNIEPGMLLMVCSIPKYIDMTHSLLEFLFLLVENYDVDHRDVITRGVLSSFNILVQKGVVHSLNVLISCNELSPVIKEKLLRFLSFSNGGVPKEVLTLKRKSTSAITGNSSVPNSVETFLSGSKKPRLSAPVLNLSDVSLLESPTPLPEGKLTEALENTAHVDDYLPVSNDALRISSL